MISVKQKLQENGLLEKYKEGDFCVVVQSTKAEILSKDFEAAFKTDESLICCREVSIDDVVPKDIKVYMLTKETWEKMKGSEILKNAVMNNIDKQIDDR